MESVSLTTKINCTAYYEDTDFSGFVYHANYLKYFERAREHMLGIDTLKELFSDGLHFVVRRIELDYKAPARFGDVIVVESTATFSRSPRVTLTQRALIRELVLVHGTIEIVLIDKNDKPARMPQSLLDKLTLAGS